MQSWLLKHICGVELQQTLLATLHITETAGQAVSTC